MKPPSTEKWDWEKEFRLEMAGIIGREGKFAMNSMVALVRSLLSRQKQEMVERIKNMKKLHTHDSVPSFTADLANGCSVCVRNHALSDAVREEGKI